MFMSLRDIGALQLGHPWTITIKMEFQLPLVAHYKGNKAQNMWLALCLVERLH